MDQIIKYLLCKEETGGGAILDASTHMIDQLIWILGIRRGKLYVR